MGITSSLLTDKNGKRFTVYAGKIPRAVIERSLFGTAVFRAIRKSKPGVWRPLAEAAIGDALIVKTSPKRMVGYVPEALRFGDEELETDRWFVLPGDWDVNPMPFQHHKSYPRMRELLSGDVRQSETYKELTAQQKEDKLPDRIRKLGDGTVDGYFDYYRALAEKMASTRAMPNFGENDKDRYVGIAIGREGQIVQHHKGHHRSIIAQFVPCNTMEAKILAIHPLWVMKVANCGSFADAIKDGIERVSSQ